MDKYLAKNTRVKWLTLTMMFGVVVLVVRLFQIQILMHDEYTAKAYAEQVKKLIIPAKRGLIYALDNGTPTPLVLNTTVYKMFIDPVVIKDEAAVKAALYSEARDNILQENKLNEKFQNKTSRYQVVANDLTRAQAEAIRAKKLVGVGFQALSKRIYPEGDLAAQVLGFVNANGGQYGVEGGLNERLTGKDGILESVTDISKVPLTIGEQNTHIPAKHGDNLVLTIDKNIQAQTEKIARETAQRLSVDNISVVVMNPNNAKVLAMANYPGYDPNNYAKVSEVALFNNPITMVPYEPGSVIKTFTVAMGINEGIIKPETTFYNSDSVKVADRTIVNAVRGHTGNVSMQAVLDYSLNTGVVEILARAGGGQINSKAINLFYSYLHDRFRFGELTGIEIPETKGLIVGPTAQDGNAVRYSNMSFGQGMNLTMLQVVTAYSAMVNGGKYYQPTIVAGIINDTGEYIVASEKEPTGQIVKAETSATMRQMMSQSRKADGTGRTDRIGFEVGGKTGTSETLRDGTYIKTQTIASYLGYGGGAKPEYVIMVQVGAKDRYLTGTTHAAPIFSELSNWLLTYMKIQAKE